MKSVKSPKVVWTGFHYLPWLAQNFEGVGSMSSLLILDVYDYYIDNYCLQLDIQLHRHLVFGKKLKWEGKKFMLWNQPTWPYSRWLLKVQPAIWKFSFLFVNFKHSLVFLTQFYFNISSFYLKMSHLKKGGIKIW